MHLMATMCIYCEIVKVEYNPHAFDTRVKS